MLVCDLLEQQRCVRSNDPRRIACWIDCSIGVRTDRRTLPLVLLACLLACLCGAICSPEALAQRAIPRTTWDEKTSQDPRPDLSGLLDTPEQTNPAPPSDAPVDAELAKIVQFCAGEHNGGHTHTAVIIQQRHIQIKSQGGDGPTNSVVRSRLPLQPLNTKHLC
jgi:hypothetical protein